MEDSNKHYSCLVLGLVLFKNLINDLDEVTECLLTKLAGYTSLGVPHNTSKAQAGGHTSSSPGLSC